MNKHHHHAKFAGLLFIVATIAYATGSAFNEVTTVTATESVFGVCRIHA